ncbi:hypothetical protein [Sorangium sp. So ce861]|uniref:hypothetical protein n=1 Tax=Sorangium sp. So ce861 TaxID=3133323 RepID=UPI003F635ED8
MLACVGSVHCGGDDTTGTPDDVDVPAGATAIVAIVNPVVNTPHTTGVPDELGDARDGITVTAMPGDSDVTADGVAVVGVPAGGVELEVSGASLSHTVPAEGDVVDAPIAFSGSAAAFFDNTPIRYAVNTAARPDDHGRSHRERQQFRNQLLARPGRCQHHGQRGRVRAKRILWRDSGTLEQRDAARQSWCRAAGGSATHLVRLTAAAAALSARASRQPELV